MKQELMKIIGDIRKHLNHLSADVSEFHERDPEKLTVVYDVARERIETELLRFTDKLDELRGLVKTGKVTTHG